ncbi:MAG: HAD family hydrolase [Desulfarculaceae bacterium]|nr:HAD family hydrolase [Desulfarculaceae bacterium]MCF8072870.1 HAD family hydrolase [Desulfarculaceae bacterium]MCF8101038.1 HAD family hydrolase [Desulfarculaceae bacterium]MCF8115575.1 HAD family hydrolase [Desulfarculaceae bacterium]
MPLTQTCREDEPVPYAALICDLDGTLIDSLDDLGESMNTVLAAEGLPTHPLPDYRYFVGRGVEQLAGRALPESWRQPERVTEMARRMRQVYADNWAVHTRPYEGIPEMLASAAGRGLRLGVLSNKVDKFTRLMVPHFFPETAFAAVAGAKQGVPAKPHPQAALDMAEGMGLEPGDCLFLGDTAVDMQTARGAGMLAVGALWGFRGEEELRQAGANALLAHPSELAALLT